ncbi:MAG TPA: TMEM175 family protein [Candidatus Nitrosotalea sp.]|nr:TMEM175 family protein [Candidatus Nitrosotalea sp.]
MPERTVHRLEAFSDIVIGFCLAQLGLSLVLPKNAADMFSVWESTTFFISAFILIAVLWWLHHSTFSTFFVLNIPMVVLNFGVLCSLILTLYFLESLAHVAALGQDPSRFFTLFVFSFALVYTLLGVMLLVGLLTRRAELPQTEIRWAVNQLTSILMAVLFGLIAGTYAALSPHIEYVAYATVALSVTVVIMRRIILRRWLGSLSRPLGPSSS